MLKLRLRHQFDYMVMKINAIIKWRNVTEYLVCHLFS